MKKIKKIIKDYLKKKNFVQYEPWLNQIGEDELRSVLRKLLPIDVNLIRVGSEFDGGYLIPQNMDIQYLFSPGVYDNDDFEVELARKGANCFLADFSVESNPTKNENLIFDKIFVGHSEDEKFISLSDWVKSKINLDAIDGGMMLSMDIEGWEYNNFINLEMGLMDKFDVMCVEFHGFERIGSYESHEFLKAIFEKILYLFDVAHVHPNNCCGFVEVRGYALPRVIEFTFINKRHVSSEMSLRNRINHSLDSPNIKELMDISIENWSK
jgi:hypothetical protein